MAHLIDKSTLVAEIERRIASLESIGSEDYLHDNCPKQYAMLVTLKSLKFSIDTLEMKEADLEKELDSWRHYHFHGRRDEEASGEYLERVSQLDLAKHFFELGLSSQLSWKDIERIAEIGMDFMSSEDSDNLNDEEYYTEILNRFKMQKGEEV